MVGSLTQAIHGHSQILSKVTVSFCCDSVCPPEKRVNIRKLKKSGCDKSHAFIQTMTDNIQYPDKPNIGKALQVKVNQEVQVRCQSNNNSDNKNDDENISEQHMKTTVTNCIKS